jgi:Domain of unknown function (DUF1905)
MQFTFTAPLWLYSGKGAWHFVTLPKTAADEIKFFNPVAKGFTPIKVTAKIGETAWKTAIFPDSKSGSYVIAIKADIRKKEILNVGDAVEISISIV